MIKCDSCDIELPGSHLVVQGKPFCCSGCADGGPCVCSYEKEDGRPPRNGHTDPIISQILYLEGQDSVGLTPDIPPPN